MISIDPLKLPHPWKYNAYAPSILGVSMDQFGLGLCLSQTQLEHFGWGRLELATDCEGTSDQMDWASFRWWVGVGQSWVWVGGWDFAGFGWDLLILVERESLNFTGMEAKSMISNRNIKEDDKGTFIWMRKMERSFGRAGSIEFKLSHLSLELTSSDLHIQVLPSTAMLIG